MAYTEAYRSFIINSNEAWIEDAKNDAFCVHCTVDWSRDPTFHIYVKRALDNGCNPEQRAQTLLETWDAKTLEHFEHVSFAFNFEINYGMGQAQTETGHSIREVVEVPSKAGGDDYE